MRIQLGIAAALACGLAAPGARAEILVDGGVAMGTPAALPTGLSLGAGAGVTVTGAVDWGLRVSWSTATEYTLDWTVRQDDLRLRATAALAHVAGRGTLSLRLGVGPTLVREDRTRDQGMRAGLTGSDLETTGWTALPAADLEAGVRLRVLDAWSLEVSGGPTLELLDGALHAGWVGGLGVAWHG